MTVDFVLLTHVTTVSISPFTLRCIYKVLLGKKEIIFVRFDEEWNANKCDMNILHNIQGT